MDSNKAVSSILKTGAAIDEAILTILSVLISLFVPEKVLVQVIVQIIWRSKYFILAFIVLSSMMAYTWALSMLRSDDEVLPVNWSNTPEVLKSYVEPGYSQDGNPHGTPFGELNKITVTAYFNDPNYYKWFKRWHQGVDLVASRSYYNENEAYKLLKRPVMFATCNGTAKSLRDGAGANYIYILCADKKYAVFFLHNEYNFLPIGQSASVVAGQPVAVMGSTGNSTGPHIHYAIKDLATGKYIDPWASLSEGLVVNE